MALRFALADATSLVGLTGSTRPGAHAMWHLKEGLLDWGHTEVASGDGLLVHSATDCSAVANNSTGANGLHNAGAWFIVRNTATGVYHLFQHGSGGGGQSWSWVRSQTNAFTGGSAAVRPTATGEEVYAGSGVAGLQMFGTSSTAYYFAWIDDETGAFGLSGYSSTAASLEGGFFYERMARGTYDAATETDPYVAYADAQASNPWSVASSLTIGTTTEMRATLGGSSVTMPAQRPALNTGIVVGNWSPHATSGKYGTMRFTFNRSSTPLGMKGQSANILWNPGNLASGQRGALADGTTYIRFGDVLWPWPSGTNAPGSASGATTPVSLYIVEADTSDVTAPTIGSEDPDESTAIAYNEAVTFDVTDESGLGRVIVWASVDSAAPELVYTGSAFASPYSGNSTTTSITDGTRFSVLRSGGWDGSVTLSVFAVDSDGNVTDESFSWDVTARSESTTTLAAIVANYTTVLRGLTPTTSADRKYDRCPPRSELRAWATTNNPDSFRRFQFTESGTEEVADNWLTVLNVRRGVTLTVAYPVRLQALYGNDDSPDAMERVIEEDMRQVRDALFSGGNLIDGHHASLIVARQVDRQPDVWFAVVQFDVYLNESQSLT